jgi:hypothetical protein
MKAIIHCRNRLGEMLKFLLYPIVMFHAVSSAQKTPFKLTDTGAGISGKLIIGQRFQNYSPYFNESESGNTPNSETPFIQSNKNERIVSIAKSLQGQVTFTQLSKRSCCLAKKAKAIRISFAYSNLLLFQPLRRSIDKSTTITQVDRVDRSKIKSVTTEAELRRIFATNEEELRIFAGLGILADFSFQHQAKMISNEFENIQKTVAINNPDSPPYYYQYEEKRTISQTNKTIKLDNSTTAGAFLCTGLYWPASEGLAMEFEVKVGKLARRLGHDEFNFHNLSSIGLNFRFLLTKRP